MNKKQQTEIVDIVSKYLPRCCSSSTCHCYGNIPRNKFRNSCDEYPGYVDYSECIGLTDETIFGSRKRGFMFTLDGYYYDNASSKRYYSDGRTFTSLSDLYDIVFA